MMTDTPMLDMLSSRRPLSAGCGDSSCLIVSPEERAKRVGAGGQHTNGGCRCFGGLGSRHMLREAARIVDALVVEADDLKAKVERLRRVEACHDRKIFDVRCRHCG